MPITTDRGDVIHFAGRHRLSPALRDAAPALVGVGDPGRRVGWAEFFAALGAAGLVASFEPGDAASFRLVPRGAAAAAGAAHARGPGALAEARRFVAALRGRLPPA
jgi:hypothetical protein